MLSFTQTHERLEWEPERVRGDAPRVSLDTEVIRYISWNLALETKLHTFTLMFRTEIKAVLSLSSPWKYYNLRNTTRHAHPHHNHIFIKLICVKKKKWKKNKHGFVNVYVCVCIYFQTRKLRDKGLPEPDTKYDQSHRDVWCFHFKVGLNVW